MRVQVPTTRDKLLGLLLRHKAGLTVDELGEKLSVSRNAIRQHLSALESDGLVELGEIRRGVGRPSQAYTLTPLGAEQFPRQYSLLSEWVLTAVNELHGPAGTAALLKQIADRLTEQYGPQIQGDTVPEKAEAVAALLNKLGYVAQAEQSERGTAVTAVNCVYHHLAAQFPEVCQLDIQLIQQLTGSRVDHTDCMVRGGQCCRFLLADSDSDSAKVEPDK